MGRTIENIFEAIGRKRRFWPGQPPVPLRDCVGPQVTCAAGIERGVAMRWR
jgi:hypothetical protein